MKIDTQPLDNHQIKVTVEATPSEFEAARQKAVRELTKKVKIPGFRPGKAPLAIALKHLDPKLIAEETLEIFIDQNYPQILEETHIDPYGPGTLESISNSEPPTMEFVIPLSPKVELGDYQSIRLPYNFEPPDETEVDKTLKSLQESYAIIEPVERPVQIGDIAYVDIHGELISEDNQPIETIADFSNYPIDVLKESKPNEYEWPFPGFSANLIGTNINDVVEIDFVFPDFYKVENFKGKKSHFTATIKSIKQRKLPELNDEFAQSLGEFTNLEELKRSIRNSLEKAKLEEYNQDYEDEILDEIIKRSTILFPPQMVEKEKIHVLEQLDQSLKRSNMDLDLYLKTRSMTKEQLEEEAQQTASERIKRTLVLFEVAKAENITIDPNQLRDETSHLYNEMINSVPKVKRSKEREQQLISKLSEDVYMEILMRNTLDKLRQIAKGEEEALPISAEQEVNTNPEMVDLEQTQVDKEIATNESDKT